MREEKKINKLVGRIGDEYYFCDYIFSHDDFHGAKGTILRPVNKDEYEGAMDIKNAKDRFYDLWAEAVEDRRTEESLEDYCQNIIDCDNEEAFWDFSGSNYWDDLREAIPELTKEEYPVFECVGGGRSFSLNMEWDEIYDRDLWELIKQAEIK